MQRIVKTNFAAAWEEMGEDGEAEETYFLTKFSTLDGNICTYYLLQFISRHEFLHFVINIVEMVRELVAHLGMQPCERSDQAGPEKAAHTLLLAGLFRGGVSVLARCKLAKSVPPSPVGINFQITVRSEVPEINQAIADALG